MSDIDQEHKERKDREILAGLSRMTISSLHYSQDESIVYSSGGPDSKGKYCGWVYTSAGRPLINTAAIFDSGDAAEQHMREVVRVCVCRGMDMDELFDRKAR